ncbi:FHA domain-containing protein [Planctomycetota bacterium]
MQIHIFEVGGGEQVEYSTSVEHATIRIGGAPPCELVLPALSGGGCAAEVRVAGGRAEIANVGSVPVSVGGRAVQKGSSIPLGAEVLLSVGGAELVFRCEAGGSAPPPSVPLPGGRQPGTPPPDRPSDDSEQPSVLAKDMLKEVYAALGVPEKNPALVVYDENNKVVKRIDLVPPQEDVTIGRKPGNRLVLYHNSVSKEHAHVTRDGLGFLVKDLGSRNGTKVNGAPVQGHTRLRSGDRVQIGQFTLRFVDPKAAVQDLAESVPDLQRIDRAAPGEAVKVGGSGNYEATTAFEESLLKQVEASTAEGDKAAKRPGVGIMAYVLIGVGLLVFSGLVAIIVLATQ